MNDQPKQVLLELFQQRGTSLLLAPKLLEDLLQEQCAQFRPEVTVLLNAYREGIPAAIKTELGQTPEATLVDRLQCQLQANQSMAVEPARWAVEAWLGALRPFAGQATHAAPAPQPLPTSTPEIPAATVQLASQVSGREEFFGPGFGGARAKASVTDGLVNIVFGVACLVTLLWITSSPVDVNDSITASKFQYQLFILLVLGIGALIRGTYKSIKGFLASKTPAPDALWYVLHDAGLHIFIDDKESVLKEGLLVPWASMDQFVSGPGGLFVKYRLSPSTPSVIASSRHMRADCRSQDGSLFADRMSLWYNAKAAGLVGSSKS